MLEIGRLNQLTVIELADLGAYLDGGEWGDILLPTKELPEHLAEGDELTVFVYRDNLAIAIQDHFTFHLHNIGLFANESTH